MINFFKRYFKKHGDVFDEERIKEFDRKTAILGYEATDVIMNIVVKMNIAQQALITHNIYSQIDDANVKMGEIYLSIEDSCDLLFVMKYIFLQWIGAPDVGYDNPPDYDEFYDLIQKYMKFLSVITLGEPYHSDRLAWFECAKKLYAYSHDFSLCHCINYAIDIIDESEILEAMFVLKKIFLSKDIYNTSAYLMIRNRILDSENNDLFRKYVSGDPQADDILSIFASDVNILSAIFHPDQSPVLERIPEPTTYYINKPLIDIVLFMIYTRYLMNILSVILKDLPEQEMYDKRISSIISKYYFHTGFAIYEAIYPMLSVQDIILYLIGELNFDLTLRTNYQHVIFKTEKFEKFAASCFSSSKYSKYQEVLSQMLEKSESIIKNNPKIFHDQVVQQVFKEKSFAKYEKKRGVKKKLVGSIISIMESLNQGKVRGKKQR